MHRDRTTASGVARRPSLSYADVPSGFLQFRIQNLELRANASTYSRSSPFNSSFVKPEADFDDPNNRELDRRAWIDLRDHFDLSQIARLSARAYGDSFYYRRQVEYSAATNCLFSAVQTCRQDALGLSQWAGLELQTSLDWRRNGSVVTLLGIDGRLRHVAAQTDSLDAATGRYLVSSEGVIQQTDRVLGAYVQQTFSPGHEINFNAGGRFDYDERFGQRLSPRLAAVVPLWVGASLKAIYSEAFRAPTREESYGSSPSQIPASNLKPETVRSIEADAQPEAWIAQAHGGRVPILVEGLGRAPRPDAKRAFQAQRLGQLGLAQQLATQYRNVSSIDDYGLNAGYEGSFLQGKLRYAVNVTEAVARRPDGRGQDLPLVVAPQFFGNARLAYTFDAPLPTFALAGRYAAQRPADRAFDNALQCARLRSRAKASCA